MRPCKRHGFTSVEPLVVLGIISLLIAILLPALATAGEAANRSVCAANLHNWGVAAHNFAVSNRGYFLSGFVHGNYNPIHDCIEPVDRTKNECTGTGDCGSEANAPSVTREIQKIIRPKNR